MALTKVTGHVIKSDTNITSHNINSSGIITAISFDGNVSGVAVTFTGDSTIGSLGITTNLNVGGISTFAGITTVTGDTLFVKQINASGITTLGDRIFAGGTSIPGYTGADDLTIGDESGHHGITIRSGASNNGGLFFSDATSAGDNGTQWAGGVEYNHQGSTLRLYAGSTVRAAFDSSGNYRPWTDSLYALGTPTYRWSNVHADAATIAGNATITGNLTVDGVLTYQDVTNIDSIGIVTARSDIRGGRNLSVVGISTFSDHINLPDNKQIKFGDSNDFNIQHNTNENYIQSNSGHIYIRANVNDDEGDDIIIQAMSGEDSIKAIHDGAVELYWNGNKKFETGDTVNINSNHFEITSGQQLRFDNSNNNRSSEILNTGSSGNSTLAFKTNGGTRWTIDSSGHIIPGTAGAVNIGSTGAEIGNVYIADDKHVYWGSGQDLAIVHNGTHGYLHAINGGFYMKVGNGEFLSRNGNQVIAKFLEGTGGVELWYNNVKKFDTVETGIEVTGEVAATQDYPNFRPTIDFNFAATKKLDPRLEYERTGPASFTDEFGKVVIVSDNAPRFDHDPTTRESKGLLIEESRTNQWLYSEDLVTYVASNEMQQSALSNTTATTNPTGGTNAVKMVATATGGAHSFYKYFASGSNGNTHTASVWVKAAGVNYARIYVDTVGGNMGGPGVTFSTGNTWNVAASGTATQAATSVVEYPNGWWRLSVSGSFSNQNAYYVHIDLEGGEGDVSFTGNGSDGMYVWGVQFEAGAFPTSYIPTNGSTATRGADFALIDGEEFTEFFNQDQGTIITSTNSLNTSATQYPMVIEGDNTNNERHIFVEANAYQYQIKDGGSTVAQIDAGSISTKNIIAAAYKLNDTAVSINGSDATTDTSATMPTCTKLKLGHWSTTVYNGYINRFIYYSNKISNSQLKTLSS